MQHDWGSLPFGLPIQPSHSLLGLTGCGRGPRPRRWRGTAKRRPPPAWWTARERSDAGEQLEAVVGTREVFAATCVTKYHRNSWMELPEMLQVIDRFERQRLAERSSLRLMMINLARASERRKARWSGSGSSAVDTSFKI